MSQKTENKKSEVIDVSDEVGVLLQNRESLYSGIATALRHANDDLFKLREIDNRIIAQVVKDSANAKVKPKQLDT